MDKTFQYQARTRSGDLIKGEIIASGTKAVAEHLWKQNCAVVSIEPKSESIFTKDLFEEYSNQNNSGAFRKKTKVKELSYFCRQFAILLNSGVPMLSCLNLLQQQKNSPALTEAIGTLIEQLEQGNSIAEGAKRSPKVFPQLFVNMVEAGELSGILDEVLVRLADHFEREHELTEKVKSAMTYPIVILLIAVTCIGFMLGYILPKFTSMLTNFNIELPLMTRIVMAASDLVKSYWLVMVGASLLVLFFAKKQLKEESVRKKVDQHLLTLPLFGEIILKREVSRFTRTLASLLRSGVNVLQALDVAKKVTDNLCIKEIINIAQDSIKDGRGLAEPLGQSKVFPPMVVQMISTGEETGNLEEMLEKASGFFDKEVEVKVSRLSSLIEPVFIVTLGLTLGFVLMAVLLPIFKVATSVQ